MIYYKSDLDKLDYVITDECLHPKTLILTPEGDKEIRDIKVGDLVLSLNETTNEEEYKPVIEVHKNLPREKTFKIKLANGKILKITGNHQVLTQRGWVRVDKLTIDDELIDNNEYDGGDH